ncbi:hypothetical protein AB0I81_31875 [Nonomuraea sp. NPDC050404]|uniref:hypothetical protein n=1 Tax=Nonomuraea sp. NPDC050404 TaxID=3155783 RepID=UPI0033E06D3A
MGMLIAALSLALGAIAALLCWIILQALGADGVAAFNTSAGALIVVTGAVIGIVQFIRTFGKRS